MERIVFNATTRLIFQQTSQYISPQLSIRWRGYFKTFLEKPFMREAPSCRLGPAFSSLSGVISPWTPSFVSVRCSWLFSSGLDLTGWEHMRLEIKAVVIHLFPFDDVVWNFYHGELVSLPSLFRTPLVLIFYHAMVKHSSSFLSVFYSTSSFSLKR